jgi:PAS domain S-box-containing protein
VVEDNKLEAEYLRHVLAGAGYEVAVARNGRAGLKEARLQKPSLVISDVVMPFMNGYDMCEKIKKDPALRDVPVVLATNLTEPEDIIYGLQTGADNYVTKPYNPENLLHIVNTALFTSSRPKVKDPAREVTVKIRGKYHVVSAQREQILNLLLATYETVLRQNRELLDLQLKLRKFNEQLKEEVDRKTASLNQEVREHMRAKETLREYAESLALAQQIAHMGSFCFHAESGRLTWSEELYRIFGFTPYEISPDLPSILKYFPPRERDRLEGLLQGWIGQEDPVITETRILRPDGTERILDIRAEVRRDEAGKPVQILGAVLDVTEKRTAEKKLEETNRMLLRADKLASLGKLSAGVVHEIKNPLTIIHTLVQMMMDGDLEKETRENYQTILDQVRRIVKITDNLKDFAKDKKVEFRALDLNEQIEKTVALLDYELRKENIGLEILLDPNPILLNGDPDLLSQVFLNIINNSRDSLVEKLKVPPAEPPPQPPWKPRLSIETSVSGDSAVVRFRDTGRGMDTETVNKIFDPFFTTKGEGKGLGLGMSISYGIVEHHGGRIQVSSEEGMGTEFQLIFPIHTEG